MSEALGYTVFTKVERQRETRNQTRPGAPGRSALLELDARAEAAWELRHTDAREALRLADGVFEDSSTQGYDRGVAYSSLARAFACFHLSRLRKARENAERGRDILGRQGDKAGSIRALNTPGIIYGESGELLLSLQALLSADALCKEIGDTQGEADALNNIGNVYGYLGDYANALDHHQQSLVVCREHSYLTAEFRALCNIGVACFELGQYHESLAFLGRVLAFDFADDTYTPAFAQRYTGRSYHKLGRADQASTYLRRSLKLAQGAGDPVGVSDVLNDLALLDLEAGRVQDALSAVQQSLALKETSGDARGESETLLLWAEVCRAQGDHEAALAALQKALVITERVGNSLERYGAYGNFPRYTENGVLSETR